MGIGRKKSVYEKYVKRPMDFMLSLAALIALSPLMLAIAVLVRIRLGKPVVFKQKRPGLNETIFTIYKFRTMTDARDENGDLLPDEDRLTFLGKALRETSLDELPGLVNILKGDMSWCGPRPQLVRDMVFMSPRQRARHRVRPGMTGLAQINGRNNAPWEEKLEWDLKYIDDGITFGGDMRILLKTMGKVLKRADVNTEGMATGEDYGDYLLRTGQVKREEYDKLQNRAKRLEKCNSSRVI